MSASAYAISDKDFNDLAAFTRTDTFGARRDRISEFFRAPKTQEVAIEVLKHGGAATAGCVIVGGGIGYGVNGPQGMAIGCAIGLGVGIVGSTAYGSYMLHREYKDWKGSEEGKKFVSKFREVVNDIPALQPLFCPINHDVIQDPVKTKCGHTFERVLLEDHYNRTHKNPNGSLCPCCNTPFAKAEVIEDKLYAAKYKKVISEVLKKELDNPLFSPAIVTGFKALEESLQFQSNEILKSETAVLTIAFQKNNITFEIFTKKIEEMGKLYI